MIAAELKVMFVAGLIVEESTEQVLPFSSAYLLGERTCKLLARKRWGDQMEGRLYTSCEEWPSMPYRVDTETVVAALICIDAKAYWSPRKLPSERDNIKHHYALRARIAETKAQRKLLCVPAHHNATLDEIQEDILGVWQDMDVIVANSSIGNCVSIIKLKDGTEVREQERVNKILVASFAPALAMQC